ncbi:MAG TPA: tetratricopeptide repeat protein, partial [Elusimicrobiota bacterium]|nr:tetratricopeptide repeat protein [Elusimicrobiota bacterium]
LVPLVRENFAARLAQSVFGLAFYPMKTLVPARLSPIYEMPPGLYLPCREVLAGAAAVLALSVLFIWLRKKWPAGLAAWACYLVLIAPLSGIFPVGRQFAADRYSYLPCLACAVLAGAVVLAAMNRLKSAGRKILIAALALVALGLGRLTWSQTEIWRDSEALWSRAIALEPGSDVAWDNLGSALAAQGKAALAADDYRKALLINPNYAKARNNLGDALASLGQAAPALAEYRRALKIDPDFAAAHYNLGLALAAQGKTWQAQAEYERAVQDAPDFAEARVNLGNILAKQGKIAQAEALYEQALAIDPGLAAARQNLFYLRRSARRFDRLSR